LRYVPVKVTTILRRKIELTNPKYSVQTSGKFKPSIGHQATSDQRVRIWTGFLRTDWWSRQRDRSLRVSVLHSNRTWANSYWEQTRSIRYSRSSR